MVGGEWWMMGFSVECLGFFFDDFFFGREGIINVDWLLRVLITMKKKKKNGG